MRPSRPLASLCQGSPLRAVHSGHQYAPLDRQEMQAIIQQMIHARPSTEALYVMAREVESRLPAVATDDSLIAECLVSIGNVWLACAEGNNGVSSATTDPLKEAQRAFERVVSFDREHPAANLGLGKALYQQWLRTPALQSSASKLRAFTALKLALSHNPRDLSLYKPLVELACDIGYFVQGRDLCRRAIRRLPLYAPTQAVDAPNPQIQWFHEQLRGMQPSPFQLLQLQDVSTTE